MLPVIKENIKVISIEKGKGIHIDLSERKADLPIQHKHETEQTIAELIRKLKYISNHSDLSFVFGARSESLNFQEHTAKGNYYQLQELHNIEIQALWE
jgi:hypothetical protein